MGCTEEIIDTEAETCVFGLKTPGNLLGIRLTLLSICCLIDVRTTSLNPPVTLGSI